MSAVSVVNLVIQKGTSFEETFILNAEDDSGLDLNNKTAFAKLKKHPTAGIAYTFSSTITIANSTVKISISPEVTATLPSGRCVYDVVLISLAGMVTKVVEGNVIVEESVSV